MAVFGKSGVQVEAEMETHIATMAWFVFLFPKVLPLKFIANPTVKYIVWTSLRFLGAGVFIYEIYRVWNMSNEYSTLNLILLGIIILGTLFVKVKMGSEIDEWFSN